MNAPEDDAEFDAAVKAFHQSGVACPLVYEGELEDGRFFRFSYRWGFASLSVGTNDFEPRIDSLPAVLAHGHDSDGWMSESDFRATFIRLLRRHAEDRTEKAD